VQKRNLAFLVVFLAAIPALSQEAKNFESECNARFGAADRNGDGFLTVTETPKADKLPSQLAKEVLVTRPAYIAACSKMLAAQAPPPPPPSTEKALSPETKGVQQPQGPTGPLETKSGGAPAESPQGQTPPGMQAAPQGSSQSTQEPPATPKR
jgi:hypothetical protein